MEVIGWDELRLRFEETEGIVRQIRDENFGKSCTRFTERQMDGLRVLCWFWKEREGARRARFPGPALQEIFDYFARDL
jgi:hypothetical protein